jgi:hypothetical protein
MVLAGRVSDDWGVLSPGRRSARTSFGFLVHALNIVVQASKCGVCGLSLSVWHLLARRWHARSVEALFPQGRERSSGFPPVGSGSWELMPLAARHTAISRMRAGAQVA